MLTPDDTRTRCGVAIFGATVGVEFRMLPITPPIEPPGTPPGTPPTTPAVAICGGASSSFRFSRIFLGILVGVRSWPLTISVWICFTTLTGAAAGGGGGGGGGGATNMNIVVPLGKASVKINGIRIMTPTIMTCIAIRKSCIMPD